MMIYAMHVFSLLLLFVFGKLSFADLSSDDDIFTDELLEPNEEDTSFQGDFLEEPDPFDKVVASNECATQQSLVDGFPLLARDGDSCSSPLPLSPGTLQLFQDPLNSLEQVLPSGELPQKTDPDGDATEVTWPTTLDKDAVPCEPYLATGQIHHICCLSVLGVYPNWRLAWDCKIWIGKFLTKKKSVIYFLTADGF